MESNDRFGVWSVKKSAVGRASALAVGRRCVVWVGIGAALLASACSGSAGEGTGETSSADSAGNAKEVASVSAAGVELTFYSAEINGKQTIGMREVGSAYASSSPVAALVAQNLTSQEIYLALAPRGATAPAALVAAQADEAALMGRSAELRNVTVDTTAVVEKSLQACESKLFNDIPISGSYWSAGPSGTFGAGSHLESLGQTAGYVLLGGCNESNQEVALSGYIYGDWPGAQNPINTFGANMYAGQYYNWYWRYYVVGACHQSGNSCVGSCQSSSPGAFGCWADEWGANYQIFGFALAGSYDLVTATSQAYIQ